MNNFISTDNLFKTKPYITTIFSLFFIFIPYGLIWLLLGEGRYFLFIKNKINLNIDAYWYNETTFTYSWEFYLVFFILLLIPILLFIIGKYIFKILEIDSIPFFYLTCAFWIGILISGLIPMPKDQTFINLIIIGKIIFIVIFSLVFFFIFNILINFIMTNSKNISNFFNDFKNEDDRNMEIIKSQKSILDNYKNKKDKTTTWDV